MADYAAGTPSSAENAKIRIGEDATTLYGMKWNVDAQTDMLPTTNMESGGYKDRIGGNSDATVTIEGWYDIGANMFDDPLDLQDGEEVKDVLLYINNDGDEAPCWNFPLMIVEKATVSGDVTDLIKYNLTLHSKGTFSYPTGNVTDPDPGDDDDDDS
jgi:hypothetical protein